MRVGVGRKWEWGKGVREVVCHATRGAGQREREGLRGKSTDGFMKGPTLHKKRSVCPAQVVQKPHSLFCIQTRHIPSVISAYQYLAFGVQYEDCAGHHPGKVKVLGTMRVGCTASKLGGGIGQTRGVQCANETASPREARTDLRWRRQNPRDVCHCVLESGRGVESHLLQPHQFGRRQNLDKRPFLSRKAFPFYEARIDFLCRVSSPHSPHAWRVFPGTFAS